MFLKDLEMMSKERDYPGAWRWFHCKGTIYLNLQSKFHQDPYSETVSRLLISSKSLPGVYEDREAPDEPEDGAIAKGLSICTF